MMSTKRDAEGSFRRETRSGNGRAMRRRSIQHSPSQQKRLQVMVEKQLHVPTRLRRHPSSISA